MKPNPNGDQYVGSSLRRQAGLDVLTTGPLGGGATAE